MYHPTRFHNKANNHTETFGFYFLRVWCRILLITIKHIGIVSYSTCFLPPPFNSRLCNQACPTLKNFLGYMMLVLRSLVTTDMCIHQTHRFYNSGYDGVNSREEGRERGSHSISFKRSAPFCSSIIIISLSSGNYHI